MLEINTVELAQLEPVQLKLFKIRFQSQNYKIHTTQLRVFAKILKALNIEDCNAQHNYHPHTQFSDQLMSNLYFKDPYQSKPHKLKKKTLLANQPAKIAQIIPSQSRNE
eukprot:TRINITY_DN2701_c0_g2_i1.p6 TRINITY_DN2701_c0_g2~~TRINITY_DN2701_c0_g2_i1.p6  ORF type:complete len:109 (+),score=7.86 TRINITY_DN2701_c0_g2_i1:606-932(+)